MCSIARCAALNLEFALHLLNKIQIADLDRFRPEICRQISPQRHELTEVFFLIYCVSSDSPKRFFEHPNRKCDLRFLLGLDFSTA
jgi:hypothetical protein